MLTCVYGGNGSGKSRYAEKLISASGDPRFYIATMIPYGESGAQRVQKHIKQRENLRFQTIEMPYMLEQDKYPSDGIVLLEDLSNVLANRMFEHKGDWESVLRDVILLSEQNKETYVVSITGYDETEYSGETADYIHALNLINEKLMEFADVVYEMKDGDPVLKKG